MRSTNTSGSKGTMAFEPRNSSGCTSEYIRLINKEINVILKKEEEEKEEEKNKKKKIF